MYTTEILLKYCVFIFSFFIKRLSRLVYKGLESSFLGLFLDVMFGIIFCAGVLVSAITITLGFIIWCSGMTQRFPS